MRTIHTDHAGADWLKSCICNEPSELGCQVADLLGVLMAGIYHCDETQLKKADWKNGRWITMPWDQEFATYDHNLLTRLVVLAHDMAIRVSITQRSRQYMEICFHPRSQREGGHISHRHPTLESAIEDIRSLYRIEEEKEVL